VLPVDTARPAVPRAAAPGDPGDVAGRLRDRDHRVREHGSAAADPDDLGVSIPRAGMLVTLYALGVVIGAPLVTIAAVRIPRARLLVLLVGLIGLGNLLSAAASDYGTLASSRLIAGLPHGAYFGVASLVASRLSPPGRRAR